MVRRSVFQPFRATFAAILLPLVGVAVSLQDARADDFERGYVFSETNAVAGNRIAAFGRAENGRLSPAYSIATGGLGTGVGLGSQGALAASEDNRWLVAVNAGSNDITVFSNDEGRLRRIDRISSHGVTPISVTIHDRVVYVLNAGGDGNIAGFYIGHEGRLHFIDGSIQHLSGNHTGPAEISFDHSGDNLVVTEKATSKIDSFAVQEGVAGPPTVRPSSGMTPFGFDFGTHDQVVVSEAFGDGTHSSVSSYKLNDDGSLGVRSASVPDHNDASCWVVVSRNGKYAFVTNTGSDDVSVLGIGRTGELTLLEPDGISATLPHGTHPTDDALSSGDRFLYVLGGVTGVISGFGTTAHGALHPVGSVTGLPAGSAGLIAR